MAGRTGANASVTVPTPWTSGGPKTSSTRKPFRSCLPRTLSILLTLTILPVEMGNPAMTLDDMLASLFPEGHDVRNDNGVLLGSGPLRGGGRAVVIGIADRIAVGVDEAIRLSRHVLNAMERGGTGPILVLADSDSQRMSKRDELLGLNEFLAHLAQCL